MGEEKIQDSQREEFIREEIKKTSSKVWTKSITYILAGLGLVAGLAWNEAIQDLVNTLFPLGKNGVIAKFVYALVITLVVVIVSARFAKKNENG